MPLLLALPQYGPRQWLRLLAVALIGAAAVQLIETVYLVEDGQSGLSLPAALSRPVAGDAVGPDGRADRRPVFSAA